ncbi:MAG: carboxymuconolactone decarboxylase family protein [Alphaproteobacteria bacterium]|nr:carboxymuconolactone decarboxylase family protein [Alphaproteobacteria bacterium]
MLKDWPNIAAEMTSLVRQLRAGIPDTMKGFSALAQAASAPKALDAKTKELVAVGISVAMRCDPCITFHVETARKHGATRDEIMETVGMAIYMGAGPAAMYAAQALEAYDQYAAKAAVAE